MKPIKQIIKGCGGLRVACDTDDSKTCPRSAALRKIAESRLPFEIGYPLVRLTAERK